MPSRSVASLLTAYALSPNTTVTTQRANRFLGGDWRSGSGRVQLWSSTRVSRGQQIPKELFGSETPPQSPPVVSPYPPVVPSLPNFSRFSLSLEPRRASSAQSIHLEPQAVPLSPSSTSSLTRTYTTGSSQSSSSGSIPGNPTKRPTNLIQVDGRGNVGCVLGQPDPPRLVIFLAPPTDQRPQGLSTSASLLVINRKFYHKIVHPSSCQAFH